MSLVNLICNSVSVFDPQVLKWMEEKSDSNEKGHQFSKGQKVEMKWTKSNSLANEKRMRRCYRKKYVLEAKDEKTRRTFLWSLEWLIFRTY